MADFPRLYPYGRSTAADRNELPEWTESHHLNIACARGIESAIRDFYNREKDAIRPGCAKAVIELYGFKRVNRVLAHTINRLEPFSADLIAEDVKEWAKGIYTPEDGPRSRYFEVDTAAGLLESFTNQAREAYQELGLFGPDHCETGEAQDYEGKVLVLSPETLREGCWTPENQLWLALDGFGCSPTARGRSIRCLCLGDRETTRWNRDDFIGVLKEEFLPSWAAEKLDVVQDDEPEQAAPAGESMGMA